MLLQQIARRLGETCVFMLVLRRAQDAQTDVDKAFAELVALPQVATLSLTPLTADAVWLLLEQDAQGARILPEIVNRLLGEAEGNPPETEGAAEGER